MNTNPTQTQRILDYMREHGNITQFEALNELGVMRLASRISNLKKQGYTVDSKFITVRNRYGEECRVKQYRLGGEEVG